MRGQEPPVAAPVYGSNYRRFSLPRLGVLLVIVLASCTGLIEGDSEIVGIWEMTSFVEGGTETAVLEDVNTASTPYIEFADTSYSGVGGCNGFESGSDGYVFEDGTLDSGEAIFNAALCVPESLMDAEYALIEMLWSGDPIAVAIDGGVMTWNQGSRRIKWRAIDGVPPPPTLPPETSVGDLECGEEEVVSIDVSSEGTTAEAVALSADDRVATVETEGDPDHFATGYNSEGEAIVVVAFQDLAPFPYRIYTCP